MLIVYRRVQIGNVGMMLFSFSFLPIALPPLIDENKSRNIEWCSLRR